MSRWTRKTVTKIRACGQCRESGRINLGEKRGVLFLQSSYCQFVGLLQIILSATCYLDETTSLLVPFLYNHPVYSEIESHTMFAYKINE